jgi:hypothetical protein
MRAVLSGVLLLIPCKFIQNGRYEREADFNARICGRFGTQRKSVRQHALVNCMF